MTAGTSTSRCSARDSHSEGVMLSRRGARWRSLSESGGRASFSGSESNLPVPALLQVRRDLASHRLSASLTVTAGTFLQLPAHGPHGLAGGGGRPDSPYSMDSRSDSSCSVGSGAERARRVSLAVVRTRPRFTYSISATLTYDLGALYLGRRALFCTG
jgi:hypothetical protein